MVLESYPLSLSKPVHRCMTLKGRLFRLSVFAVPKSTKPTHLYYLQTKPLSFAPYLIRLLDLPFMGPNTPLGTQVCVTLLLYKLNVSYYYFPF